LAVVLPIVLSVGVAAVPPGRAAARPVPVGPQTAPGWGGHSFVTWR